MTNFDFVAMIPEENILLIISLIQIVGFFILAVIGFRLKKLIKQYKSLLTGQKEINLEGILLNLNEKSKDIDKRLKKVEIEIKESLTVSQRYLQHWSLSRYKAFANTGGDQSFSLVLLDNHADGFIISSIYGRDESRVYAKTIKEGKSGYPLSDEEQEILAKVIRNKK